MARRRDAFGYIIEKAPKLFAIRWREEGRLKFRSGFKSRKAAADELAALRSGIADGSLIERRRAEKAAAEKKAEEVTFASVAGDWLRLHSAAKCSSHRLNEMNYRIHVAPFFGDCPLSAVTPTRILELRAHLKEKTYKLRRRGEDGKIALIAKQVSPKLVNLVLALVRSVLRFAVTHGHIAKSPIERIGHGNLMLAVEGTKLAPPIERPEDVGRLLDEIQKARPDRHALFATFIYCGLRKGEACALRWEDVDLERRILMVRRSFQGPTKSKRHRDVPIPSVMVDILRHHRNVEPYGGELVFPNDAGEMYTKNGKLEDVLRPALAAVGLRQIRLHDLRHVYASHFLMAGGSLYDLQKNLGHHSVTFTEAVYGHLSPNHRVKESDRLSGRFTAPAPANVIRLETAKRTGSALPDQADSEPVEALSENANGSR